MRYEGRADDIAALEHYAMGFLAHGYAQFLMSAAPEGGQYDDLKGAERVRFEITPLRQGKLKTTIPAVLPCPVFQEECT